MSKKLLLIIALAGAAAGLAYLISGLACVPDLAQFEATGELAKTEYRVREQITVEPFLTYTGMRRQVTIYAGTPLFFVEVYTAENEKVLELPILDDVAIVDFLWSHSLRRNLPYNEKDRWPRGIGWLVGHRFDANILDYAGAYSFRLEQVGSYKVVVRAEFMVGGDGTSRLTVYSEPIWVQMTG
jgi:hypothetical protein